MLAFCNVLHIGRAIPTYRIYGLYDNHYEASSSLIIMFLCEGVATEDERKVFETNGFREICKSKNPLILV